MTLGDNIKKYRKEVSLTQVELAERLGVAQNHIYRWERDKITPSIESLKKLAKELHVSVDSLLFTRKEREQLKPGDKELIDKLKDIDTLSSDDRITILNMIDALKLKSARKQP